MRTPALVVEEGGRLDGDVVMGDVDTDAVAKAIVAKKIGNAGQTCVCYNRIYIHESIYGDMRRDFIIGYL